MSKEKSDDEKERCELEMIALKGIGVELQKLQFPKMRNLEDMLRPLGYYITTEENGRQER